MQPVADRPKLPEVYGVPADREDVLLFHPERAFAWKVFRQDAMQWRFSGG